MKLVRFLKPFCIGNQPYVRGQSYQGWKGSGTPWSYASSENIPCLSIVADQYILGHTGATSKLTLSCAYIRFGGLSHVLCLSHELCQSIQLCLTLCNIRGCSPPGSPVYEIFQARILQWVAMYLLCLLHCRQNLYH